MISKRFGFVIVLSLFVLLPAYAAELDLASDPLWRALVLEAPVSGEPVPGAENLSTKALCTANCGTTTVSCSSSGTCTAVDRNCAAGQRGYVQCGTTKTFCPSLCPVNNCGANGICATNCNPPDPDCAPSNPCRDNPARGCYYVWSPQDLCCYTSNPGCFDICL